MYLIHGCKTYVIGIYYLLCIYLFCLFIYVCALFDSFLMHMSTSGQDDHHDAILLQYQMLACAVPRHPLAVMPITAA